MFYLKEFFSVVWELKGRGLFFVASTLLLAAVCIFRPSVNLGLIALAPDAWARPYFTALFDSTVNREEVLEEIRRYPEVATVEPMAKAETGGVLGRLIQQMGESYSADASNIAAFGLRVVLKNSAAQRKGETLVTGLENSFGSEHVTTSGVRTPKVGGLFSTHPIFRYLSRFGYPGILVPVLILWAFAFALCFSHFSRRAFLVERFQRRQLVRAKTTAAGIGFIAILTAVISVMLQGPDLVGIALCFAAFSIPWTATMREVKWRSQN
jgi:hypothetical protein